MNRIRNTFTKKAPNASDSPSVNNENLRPSPYDQGSPRSSYTGSRTSSSISIKRKEEPPEYKLSVIDGNVYLPPSPPEKKSFWPSSRQNSHRSLMNENEPFSISRESFESYRRSFDISARSPVCQDKPPTPRRSLDARHARPSAPKISSPRFERPDLMEEEPFEDIGLDGEAKSKEDSKQSHAKRRGLFSRFGDMPADSQTPGDASRPSSSHRGFHLPGRKRGQSGQGSELGNMERSAVKDGVEVTAQS